MKADCSTEDGTPRGPGAELPDPTSSGTDTPGTPAPRATGTLHRSPPAPPHPLATGTPAPGTTDPPGTPAPRATGTPHRSPPAPPHPLATGTPAPGTTDPPHPLATGTPGTPGTPGPPAPPHPRHHRHPRHRALPEPRTGHHRPPAPLATGTPHRAPPTPRTARHRHPATDTTDPPRQGHHTPAGTPLAPPLPVLTPGHQADPLGRTGLDAAAFPGVTTRSRPACGWTTPGSRGSGYRGGGHRRVVPVR